MGEQAKMIVLSLEEEEEEEEECATASVRRDANGDV
jgi:hypothetical protein